MTTILGWLLFLACAVGWFRCEQRRREMRRPVVLRPLMRRERLRKERRVRA